MSTKHKYLNLKSEQKLNISQEEDSGWWERADDEQFIEKRTPKPPQDTTMPKAKLLVDAVAEAPKNWSWKRKMQLLLCNCIWRFEKSGRNMFTSWPCNDSQFAPRWKRMSAHRPLQGCRASFINICSKLETTQACLQVNEYEFFTTGVFNSTGGYPGYAEGKRQTEKSTYCLVLLTRDMNKRKQFSDLKKKNQNSGCLRWGGHILTGKGYEVLSSLRKHFAWHWLQ